MGRTRMQFLHRCVLSSVNICCLLLLLKCVVLKSICIISNAIGHILFERTSLNELFDKPIIYQILEEDRQLSLWWNITGL